MYYVHFYVTTQNVPEGCDTLRTPALRQHTSD